MAAACLNTLIAVECLIFDSIFSLLIFPVLLHHIGAIRCDANVVFINTLYKYCNLCGKHNYVLLVMPFLLHSLFTTFFLYQVCFLTAHVKFPPVFIFVHHILNLIQQWTGCMSVFSVENLISILKVLNFLTMWLISKVNVNYWEKRLEGRKYKQVTAHRWSSTAVTTWAQQPLPGMRQTAAGCLLHCECWWCWCFILWCKNTIMAWKERKKIHVAKG